MPRTVLGRGGCHNRWHSLAGCDHRDPLTRRTCTTAAAGVQPRTHTSLGRSGSRPLGTIQYGDPPCAAAVPPHAVHPMPAPRGTVGRVCVRACEPPIDSRGDGGGGPRRRAQFPEIQIGDSIAQINGAPVPRTLREAMPMLKALPLTLEFSKGEMTAEYSVPAWLRECSAPAFAGWACTAPVGCGGCGGGGPPCYFSAGVCAHSSMIRSEDARRRNGG
jgi:hypothetical protein